MTQRNAHPTKSGPNKPLSRRDKHRICVKALKPAAPGPKFAKARKHNQHVHELRDESGQAYTLIGGRKSLIRGRRKWLAGISAQRGW